MIARYSTACAECGDTIRPGDSMRRHGQPGRGQWAHHTCPADASAGKARGTADAPAAEKPGWTALPVGGAPQTPQAGPTTPLAGQVRTRSIALPSGTVEVYTDGSCSGNPGPGGWAWAVHDGPQAAGGETPTTNQRMEIRAALEAVRALGGPLVVVSDSTYVVNCFRDAWWRGWLARGWTTSAKKPVANRDLWEPLVDVVRERGDVSFRWVKGHSGNPMNDLVDRLAVAAGAAAAAGNTGGPLNP